MTSPTASAPSQTISLEEKLIGEARQMFHKHGLTFPDDEVEHIGNLIVLLTHYYYDSPWPSDLVLDIHKFMRKHKLKLS